MVSTAAASSTIDRLAGLRIITRRTVEPRQQGARLTAVEPTRIVVAEDNYLVREGLVRLLETQDGLDVIDACEDYDGLLAAVRDHAPDVVITDIRMPPTGTDEGVRAANEIRQHHPDTGVVVLSQYLEPGYALALLEHGSSGRAYLLKERVSEIEQLRRAIDEVKSGGSVIDPKVVEALVDARSRRRDSPLDRLTPREREVLAEMAQGRNNAGVAAALGLSERAVEKHINAVFSKLDLSADAMTDPDVHRRVKAVLLYLADAG
jgi:DNA-binding NarL/FixJ family response regulator